MNYYDAREIVQDGKPTGLFHYTARNDDRVFPVGYCRDGCLGHSTKEEACEHYRQYLLDHARYDGEWQGMQQECCVCGAWTSSFALLDRVQEYALCDEHRNRNCLEALVPKVNQIISSW